MPSIFLRYGSWLVTGMTLVMSLIAAVMVTAISGTIIVEEDELLQFAVDSSTRPSFFSYSCGTNLFSSTPHNPISWLSIPPSLPSLPRHLEFLEYCHHPELGFTVLRRHPADPEDPIALRHDLHETPFQFLRFIPGPHREIHHPCRINRPRPLRPPSTSTTLVDEAIRTTVAQETPPLSNSSSSQQSFTVFLPRNDEPSQQDSPELSSLPEGQLRLREGNGSSNYGLTRAYGRSSTRGRASATSRGRVSVRPIPGPSTRRNQQVPSANGHANVQNLWRGGSHHGEPSSSRATRSRRL
jgi:hypothetical protein